MGNKYGERTAIILAGLEWVGGRFSYIFQKNSILVSGCSIQRKPYQPTYGLPTELGLFRHFRIFADQNLSEFLFLQNIVLKKK